MPLRARSGFEPGLDLVQFTFQAESGGLEPHPLRSAPLSKRAAGQPAFTLQLLADDGLRARRTTPK